MKPRRPTLYRVVLKDGTEFRNLTLKEAEQKVQNSQNSDNEWRGVYIQSNYETT